MAGELPPCRRSRILQSIVSVSKDTPPGHAGRGLDTPGGDGRAESTGCATPPTSAPVITGERSNAGSAGTSTVCAPGSLVISIAITRSSKRSSSRSPACRIPSEAARRQRRRRDSAGRTAARDHRPATECVRRIPRVRRMPGSPITAFIRERSAIGRRLARTWRPSRQLGTHARSGRIRCRPSTPDAPRSRSSCCRFS